MELGAASLSPAQWTRGFPRMGQVRRTGSFSLAGKSHTQQHCGKKWPSQQWLSQEGHQPEVVVIVGEGMFLTGLCARAADAGENPRQSHKPGQFWSWTRAWETEKSHAESKRLAILKNAIHLESLLLIPTYLLISREQKPYWLRVGEHNLYPTNVWPKQCSHWGKVKLSKPKNKHKDIQNKNKTLSRDIDSHKPQKRLISQILPRKLGKQRNKQINKIATITSFRGGKIGIQNCFNILSNMFGFNKLLDMQRNRKDVTNSQEIKQAIKTCHM